MRAIAYAIIGVLTLATAGAAMADDMSGMAMSSAPAAKHGQGTGVIKAIVEVD